ncbi:aldose 1-epimerase [Sandaracinobacteroides saxicola]|uniref:Aldose 1-epimerase n=1 Tax=Sandaracinobacteroides saxicola TaxID=2759707 RepID=A0A7G5IG48_9SPHN|nr:aldose 1-epimerase [Sandaracinobacteroides saxicola]QMW22340.1 aldose 1-epimerase [Sandaracinobacteroides saxicola]
MRLVHGEQELIVAPAVGGSIAAWRWRGRDILRPAPAGADDALQMGCFPMLPFTGRIRDGRFRWDGIDVALPPNLSGSPHAIHGQGWQRAWAVADSGEDHATLTLAAGGDEWPWIYAAEQRLVLGEDRLDISLSVRNRDARVMPLGFGLHPWFVRHPDTRLQAAHSGWWESDGEILPTRFMGEPGFDLSTRLNDGALLDHVFAGHDGRAVLSGGGLRVAMHAAHGWLVIYAPVDESFLCVEPVSHPATALNQPGMPGIIALPPGGEAVTTLSMRVSAMGD